MARALAALVKQKIGNRFGRVLEIGCGTGLLTRQLQAQLEIDTFFANDLVPEAEPYAREIFPRVRFFSGDAEAITHFPGQLDLVVSNAAFQWLAEAEAFLEKIRGLLRTGGHLVFSTFGPENLREINRLLGIGLYYPDFERMEAVCEKAFEVLYGREESMALHFPDVFSVLRHLQSLGVNGVTQHAWSRASWRDLARRYHEEYGTQQGLPLTYHPFFFVLRPRLRQEGAG